MVAALVNGKAANIGDDKREAEKHNQWSQRVQNLAEKKFEESERRTKAMSKSNNESGLQNFKRS